MTIIMADNPRLKQLIEEEKWAWKMNWCKKMGLAPAQKHAWDKAEDAWELNIDKERNALS
jgi:hypothetical protein